MRLVILTDLVSSAKTIISIYDRANAIRNLIHQNKFVCVSHTEAVKNWL